MRQDGEVQGNRLCGFVRLVIAVVGGCSIAWVLLAYPSLRQEAAFAAAAQHVLSGEQYNAEQLNELRGKLGASSAISLGPSALNDIAVIRLRLVEADLASGPASAADLDTLQRSLDAAINHNPARSFLWLTDYWLQRLRSDRGPADSGLLRMSYLTGPNEAWIALKRNPVGLAVFQSLSEDLKGRVIAEFAGLVQSWLYQDAATILAGPGWPVHEWLLAGLARLDEGHRSRFARTLQARDIEDAMVPGMEQPGSHRPF
jgi:hypothetical protein